jgi:hypothetical protein
VFIGKTKGDTMAAQTPILLTNIVVAWELDGLERDRELDMERTPNACAGCRWEQRCVLSQRESQCNVVVCADCGMEAAPVEAAAGGWKDGLCGWCVSER